MSEMSAGVRNLQGALRRGWQRTPRTLHALFREDAMRNWCQHPTRTSIIEVQERSFAQLLGPKPRKNSGSHIDASHSRQPLVKGERLVRNEVNAVMPQASVILGTTFLLRIWLRLCILDRLCISDSILQPDGCQILLH